MSSILKGRQVITTPYLPASMSREDSEYIITKAVIADILNNGFVQHFENVNDIERLYNYYLGEQDIMTRVKKVRPDVDNKVVLNYTQAITRNINGYVFKKPVSYTQFDSEKKDGVTDLNRMMRVSDKETLDLEMGEDRSVCGTSYLKILPSTAVAGADESIPFSMMKLDPMETFIMYYSGNKNLPVIGVTYYETSSPAEVLNGTVDRKIVGVAYTADEVYEFETSIGISNSVNIRVEQISEPKLNILGAIPIVEYPNNQFRLGDWEKVMTILDAMNVIASDSVNDIAQFVSSILVLLNAELPKIIVKDPATGEDVEVTDTSTVNAGIISLISPDGVQTDAKYIAKQLDTHSIEKIYDILKSSLYTIVGIPDRKTNSDTGGDTGEAVTKRDGWEELAAVANSKELYYKKSERRMLRVCLRILDLFRKGLGLEANDIDIKFSRNITNDLNAKVNAIVAMNGTQLFHPEDMIELAEIVLDSQEIVKRGEEYWNAKREEQMAQQQELQQNQVNKDKNVNKSNDKKEIDIDKS